MPATVEIVPSGDLVTARLLFRRAAEAGDAEGALALGATYDPGVLAKLGVRGISYGLLLLVAPAPVDR